MSQPNKPQTLVTVDYTVPKKVRNVNRPLLILRKQWIRGGTDASGKLILRTNEFSEVKYTNRKDSVSNDYAPFAETGVSPLTNSSQAQKARGRAGTIARARMRGKLFKGSANLGVVIGTYTESRDMIITRANDLNDFNRMVAGKMSRRMKRRTYTPHGAHLEFIFGWQPLYSDLWAAANTVIQMANKEDVVRALGKGYYDRHTSSAHSVIVESGATTVGAGTRVKITNPNLWLANRAGLLNPANVIWDLIPWSWLLGMFVNIQQLINSVTDEIGLGFSNEWTASLDVVNSSSRKWNTYPPSHPFFGIGECEGQTRAKVRTQGLPGVSLTYKIPDLSWGTAAMAASLAVGRMGRLSKFFSKSL